MSEVELFERQKRDIERFASRFKLCTKKLEKENDSSKKLKKVEDEGGRQQLVNVSCSSLNNNNIIAQETKQSFAKIPQVPNELANKLLPFSALSDNSSSSSSSRGRGSISGDHLKQEVQQQQQDFQCLEAERCWLGRILKCSHLASCSCCFVVDIITNGRQWSASSSKQTKRRHGQQQSTTEMMALRNLPASRSQTAPSDQQHNKRVVASNGEEYKVEQKGVLHDQQKQQHQHQQHSSTNKLLVMEQKLHKTRRKRTLSTSTFVVYLILLLAFALIEHQHNKNHLNKQLTCDRDNVETAKSDSGGHLQLTTRDTNARQPSGWTTWFVPPNLLPAVECATLPRDQKQTTRPTTANKSTGQQQLPGGGKKTAAASPVKTLVSAANKPPTTSNVVEAKSSNRHRQPISAHSGIETRKKSAGFKRMNQQIIQMNTGEDMSSEMASSSSQNSLQISITPRVSQIRVPVESNAILKCLISSQTNKFNKKFEILWSRFMYDENVYEQIESFPATSEPETTEVDQASGQNVTSSSTTIDNNQYIDGDRQLNEIKLFNRQRQLREFLARSRQETNAISDLLIEATLSISPVKASDNASYYCTATDGAIDQSQARIDLVALSRPIVQLERVHPARDSKSALIYWLIVSDGNTPIKKTILMVRNDTGSIQSSSAASADRADFGQQQESVDSQPMGHSQFAQVVTDSDYNQWQKIDISADGEPSSEPIAPDITMGQQLDGLLAQTAQTGGNGHQGNVANSNGGGDSIVRADVDVTSSAGSSNSAGSAQLDDYYLSRSRWRHSRFNRRQRFYNLSSLLPGVTYNFRLAAINDMGQSNWTYLTATMPNEIPAQISEKFLLARSNDSLAIGWRRPSYDNAKTLRYEMQLFDLNRTLTLDANTNTSATSLRTNFMYVFVNLNPGTDYHFHVRACSKAGCSAFSSPKLLASTLDGEPDEPMDVELNCHYLAADSSGGNVTVSWLPPVNTRGQLVNYSVIFDSYASYRNQSNRVQVDEWRSTLETQDNHTLSLETSGILMPNTNYSVRVCANNRSKHCGRLSSLSSRTQCSTPAELPRELPANIHLTTKAVNLKNLTTSGEQVQGDSETERSKGESLVLELPFISRRNGTIDCIQVVLIRLPKSYNSSPETLSLAHYLPSEPSDMKLSSFIELQAMDTHNSDNNIKTGQQQQQAESNEKAVAYLADELDQNNLVVAMNQDHLEHNDDGLQHILLGDGFQQTCQSLKTTSSSGELANNMTYQVFDGALKAQTYYTGFIKLILIRPNDRQATKPEILTKYSYYFNPVKTGDSVIEVPMPNDQGSTVVQHFATNPFSLNSQMNFQEMASRLGSSLRLSMSKLYSSTSNLIGDNFKLDVIGNFIMQSSPLMQLLEIGVLVVVLCLLMLFVIYIISLPASMRRKRKRKMKRRLQKHQEAADESFQLANGGGAGGELCGQSQVPNYIVAVNQAANGLQQGDATGSSFEQQQSAQAIASNMGYQQIDSDGIQQQQQSYGSTLAKANQECPIHSSPLNHRNQIDNQQQSGPINQTRPPVHVCQPIVVNGSITTPNNNTNNKNHNHQVPYSAYNHHHAQPPYHHHHHMHNHAQQQQTINYTSQELARQEQIERNCRTTSRRQLNANSVGAQLDSMDLSSATGMKNFTLSHHNSVLALAKKINKSIPLRLFGAVFECRLRNGWLKEEYEQLPRQQLTFTTPADLLQNNGLVKPQQVSSNSQLLLKLRPQLIVSRNDTVSALISGNDQYDASLVKLNIANGVAEKRIICAKSPLDADSVWDFWRLVYEQEVSTIVMLTQNEDPNTGELRCAQYWPTCDNEETTILSPCNEHVQKSSILPAKFKIRQETLEEESIEDHFKVRRLTLMVMATKPGENDQNDLDGSGGGGGQRQGGGTANQMEEEAPGEKGNDTDGDNEEELVIVERSILHLQFYYWNTSNLSNQMRLIKFIEIANERHSRSQLDESPLTSSMLNLNPMLVHCFNGLGRSGLFTAMSFIIDELSVKLNNSYQEHQQDVQQLQKMNIFQLVSRLRTQREMLLSPYRLYELVYQLTSNCIPAQEHPLVHDRCT